jgi:import inner membrane translocase subunit TIM54
MKQVDFPGILLTFISTFILSTMAQLPPTIPKPESGFDAALKYTGVPPSVLKWRPRMPSKKMTVFLSLVAGGSYAYWYDRKECARLKQEYISRVEHLSKQPLDGSLAFGRKVTVYAAKWPEDDDYDRGLKYFKRYVKVSPH